MRLTLRTLLAYLDDILDPQDAELLQKKIEDSEFATSLVHQIRGSVRRLRLDAPALDAQGIGGDLNSVAEYLDNVLPPEQVPSLEKACLDNEVNLGEVASSHQILTLVLGQPADINDQMRQRAYAIAPTAAPSELPPPTPIPHIEAHPPHSPVPAPASGIVAPSKPQTPPPSTTASDKAAPVVRTDPPQQTPTPSSTSDTATPVTQHPPKRPSERFKAPKELPSTREAWRAEAKRELDVAHPAPGTNLKPTIEKPAEKKQQVAAAVVPVSPRSPALPAKDYPEYMERKGSWLRSAFVTGLIALLILAGLLFATSPIENNFLANWFGGQSTQVLVDNDATESVPLSPRENVAQREPVHVATPVDVAQPVDIASPVDVASANVQAQTQTPSMMQQPNASEVVEPIQVEVAEAPAPPPPAWKEPIDVPNVVPNSGDNLMPPKTNELPNRIVTANDAFETESFQSPSEDPFESTEATFAPPVVEPVVSEVPRDIASQQPVTGDPVLQNLPDENTGEDVALTTNVPSRDLLPEVPPAPKMPEANVARAESTIAALPTLDSTVPLVDPTVDLESAPVDPPVASPAANVASNELVTTNKLPDETPAPDPSVTPTLERTTLKQPNQLLLSYDESTDDFIRVDSTIPLEGGDVLMCLPAFRADIEIGDEGKARTCTLVDATRVLLGPANDITLVDGKILLRNQREDDMQSFRFEGEQYRVQLGEAGGLVAIEASRLRVPGSDLEEPALVLLRIHALRSDISVRFMGKVYDINEGNAFVGLNNFEPRVETDTQTPEWVSPDSGSPADMNTVRLWTDRKLGDADGMRLWLQELASNRRYAERALAARCLAEMNDFQAIVKSLDDPEQHSFWDSHFATLKRAITRGPEAVESLRLEFAKKHGDQRAAFLMEMIRGYDEGQLLKGAAATLVKYLQSNRLDERVLAFQNLKNIAGLTKSYRAEQTSAKRNRPIRSWAGALKAGKIKYREVPEVVALIKSFAANTDEAATN